MDSSRSKFVVLEPRLGIPWQIDEIFSFIESQPHSPGSDFSFNCQFLVCFLLAVLICLPCYLFCHSCSLFSSAIKRALSKDM